MLNNLNNYIFHKSTVIFFNIKITKESIQCMYVHCWKLKVLQSEKAKTEFHYIKRFWDNKKAHNLNNINSRNLF